MIRLINNDNFHINAMFDFGRLIVAIFLVGWIAPNSTTAQDLTPAQAKAIAAEAFIYGFPIVENYKTTYDYAIDKEKSDFWSRVVYPAMLMIVLPVSFWI